jgi:voltage-gated potassium channel Kch
MLEHIALGSFLTGLTAVVHGFCTALSFQVFKTVHVTSWTWTLRSRLLAAVLVATMVVTLFLAALLESWMWAVAYVELGAISSLEEAFYFSTVTLTTLGYGDVTLSGQWRLLSSFEAANGMLLFGWSTALVFAVVQRLYDAMKSSDPSASRAASPRQRGV